LIVAYLKFKAATFFFFFFFFLGLILFFCFLTFTRCKMADCSVC